MSKIQNAIDRIQEDQSQKPASKEKPLAPTESAAANIDWANLDLSTLHQQVKVDLGKLAQWGMTAPNDEASPHAREFREIKRPLIAHAFGRRATKVENGKLIMVTSALSGEGKTFTSFCLAFSCAREADIDVLLVDADVAKPELSDLLGISEELGFMDLLEDRSIAPEQIIFKTDCPGLYVMSAGKPRDAATELLASSRMDEVATILESKLNNTLVILDSPPILLTSEAKAIGDIAGQLVVVVRSDNTEQSDVLAAVSQLNPEKAIGLVLNKVADDGKHKAYGYGYGYKEGQAVDKTRAPQAPDTESDSQKPDIWD